MRELHFEYFMEIKFEEPVMNHKFSLKCVPRTNSMQRIEKLHVELFPADNLSESADSFGNHILYGEIEHSHQVFRVSVTGSAVTGLSDGETEDAPWNVGKYKVQTAYTMPNEELKNYYEICCLNYAGGKKNSPYEKALYMMKKLHQDMQYEKGVTDIHTTAAEAFALKKGVCQDYAHILVCLCRMDGVPARYVVGMLEGEGYSHAWVEIYAEGKWYGLDPTNDMLAEDGHIKISSGRDYNDCLLNQGLFTGGGKQTQTIHVLVSQGKKFERMEKEW